jgi:hypothetical protein
VKIVLKQEKRLYVLENPIPNAPIEDVEEEVMNEHQRHVDDDEQATCLMRPIGPKLFYCKMTKGSSVNTHIKC